MRAQDYAKLEAPFSPSDDPELAFPKAVGIDLPEIEQLYREIFDDLDDKVFGVGWWAPDVPPWSVAVTFRVRGLQ